MAFQRKIFRIEELMGDRATAAAGEAPRPARKPEMAAEIETLRSQLGPHKEAIKLKGEIDIIDRAIRETKREIATLSDRGIDGRGITRVAHELDAVVSGTENATLRILKATEDIEQTANSLAAALKTDHEQGMAEDIQDHTTAIFEACNFQDLTGQRIGKVIQTFKLIEDHVGRMSEIWRRIEQHQIDTLPDGSERPRSMIPSTDNLLNGPKLPGEPGHSSQAEIDEIFAASWSVTPAA